MCSCPWMEGARDRASTSNTSCKSERATLYLLNSTPVTLYPYSPLSSISPPSHSLICSPSPLTPSLLLTPFLTPSPLPVSLPLIPLPLLHLPTYEVLAAAEPLDLLHVLSSVGGGGLLALNDYIVGQHDSVEGPTGVASPLGGQAAVAPNHKHTVTRLQWWCGEGKCGEKRGW